MMVVAILLIEGVARLGLYVLAARGIHYEPITDTLPTEHRRVLERVLAGSTHYLDYDSTLGWTIRPGGREPPLYRANAEGIRADHEYAPEPPPGVLRVAAFGDSFTHGDDVANSEAWTARLERAGMEVLNFGVAGYGLDQALLRYRREARHHHPHVVLIGYMADDIERAVSVYRPFYHPTSRAPLTKPRFRLVHDSLELVPNPMSSEREYRALLDSPATVLPRLGDADYYYHTMEHAGPLDALGTVRLGKLAWRMVRQSDGPEPNGTYNPRSEAFAVTVATMSEFVREVRADGATPVILLFPQAWDLGQYRRTHTRSYDPLRVALDRAGLPYLDVIEAFEGCRDRPVAALVPYHYSALANDRVAAYLAARLDRHGIRATKERVKLPDCGAAARSGGA